MTTVDFGFDEMFLHEGMLILAQFHFTASETELDCYYQKVNVRVASRD